MKITEVFICDCHSPEHQIIFTYHVDEEGWNEVYADIHLAKNSFWSRLKCGIKHIFGYKSRYGAFDEFIFNTDDIDKLEKIVDFLKKTKVNNQKLLND
jgi:hypothetical protein